MAKSFKLETSTVLAWVLGLFFLAIGIQEAVGYGSTGATVLRGINSVFGKSDVLTLVFAIVEIVCGVLLLIAPLGILKPGVRAIALLIVAIFWVVVIVFKFFVNGAVFKPDTLSWIADFALYLIVLVAIWSARGSKE